MLFAQALPAPPTHAGVPARAPYTCRPRPFVGSCVPSRRPRSSNARAAVGRQAFYGDAVRFSAFVRVVEAAAPRRSLRPLATPCASSLTEEFLSRVPGGGALEGLRTADRVWSSIRSPSSQPAAAPPRVIEESSAELGRAAEYDVLICGGTLGVFLGAALAAKGFRVAIVERGELRGRVQEWNISRREMEVFVEMGLLTRDQLERAMCTEYNPARVGFKGGKDIWVRDVLNVGVDPVYLLEQLKAKFLASGGTLLERTPFSGATVHPDGVEARLGERKVTARLLLDAMGNLSPIAKQARGGRKPDSVCAVVGTCATGFKSNDTGDLIYSFTPMQGDTQYFWEAFPARDGRTTYMFTYMDASPERPSLEAMFEDYLRLLPEYQDTPLSEISPLRALYGFFPSYRESPLRASWDRVQHVGDSSGNQSPLSFGGFGSMVRHLRRLADGVSGALQNDQLSRADLALLQPYQPSISVAWLFQKTMSARVGQGRSLSPNHINDVLNVVFAEMQKLGDPVLRPFLQDVIQWPALTRTMVAMSLADPVLVAKVMAQVGPAAIADWTAHYVALGLYGAAAPLLEAGATQATGPLQERWRARQRFEAIRFGSAQDYTYHEPSQ